MEKSGEKWRKMEKNITKKFTHLKIKLLKTWMADNYPSF